MNPRRRPATWTSAGPDLTLCLEVTLQRTAAFSFPIRANNSLDFDGIDLSCRETGGRQRGVHLIIDKARVRGDISRIWEDNVRLIVDSLLIEDISPE